MSKKKRPKLSSTLLPIKGMAGPNHPDVVQKVAVIDLDPQAKAAKWGGHSPMSSNAPAAECAGPKTRAKSGTGDVLIGASYPPQVRRVLKLIEADTGRNLKQLLGEAINMLASHYGEPEPWRED